MISDHLTKLTYLFPWSLFIALLLAAVFAVIGILLFRNALKSGQEGPKPKKDHPWIEKIQLFISRYGYFSTDPISNSFTSALKLMHSFIGGNQFRYQLPWIMMVGSSNAGKSSALRSLDIDLPIGRPEFIDESGEIPLLDWWFYDHGIVLDVDGKLIIDENQAASDEDRWQLLLNLLTNHRPKRPLDGVVLNIPATEFIGSTALSHDDVMIRADYVYEKLWQIQRITGVRVPIYVVVTKCDSVPGFESFCKSIPAKTKHNIFGWSNDRALDSIYATEWLDEAFTSINDSLYRAQQEIYAESENLDNRDGVFLFPLALNQLKGGIRTYTDHIFKPSGYHESFFLRGIYFIGDSQINGSKRKSQAEDISPMNIRSGNDELKRNIYFIKDLFEKKIFREVGLARPVSRTLLGNSSLIKFAKVAVVVASIIGTLGLLMANTKLQTSKVSLVPALTQVEITLEKIRGQDQTTNPGRVLFDEQAQVLLNAMTQISVNNLYSPFIPASWLSSLNNKISFVMGVAYENVILKSMAGQLAYKATQLVDVNTPMQIDQKPGNGIDPLETMEFYRLQKYVIDLRALELAANKFNELNVTSSSLRDVADIIKYLFDYDMPKDFFSHELYYVDALKRTNLAFFDFDSYTEQASQKLSKLFDAFEFASFNPNTMIPGLSALMTNLNEFSGARNYAAYDSDVLRNIYTSLQQTISSISDPGLNWLDADHFTPGPQYEFIKGLIVGSSLITSNTASDLMQETDRRFILFRKLLASYRSALINGENLFITENGMAISEPSRGAVSLQANLASFFSEPFMAPAEEKNILTEVPTGSVLLWDTLRLQQAVDLINSYNDFINSRLLGLPKNLQPMLQKVAREGLTKNLVQYVANAQVFSSTSISANSSAPEDALLSQIQNYRASAPYLEKILYTLNDNNVNTTFSTLKQLLTTENYSLLQELNSILLEEPPYAIKNNSFDWWIGNNLAALQAFSVTNLTELKNYLDLQRDRIKYLSREFGDPLVHFLNVVNKEGMPGNLPLVAKWEGIENELKGYDLKAPGNGLVELEDYIMNPLNEVTLATCRKYARTVNQLSLSNDFFVSILIDLQEKLNKRCVDLSGYVSVDQYSELAQYFNAKLAGRFPFTEKADCSGSDASPEDIKTFYQMMDSKYSGIKAALKEASTLGAAGKKALTFIEQMEQVRAFFGGFVAPDSSIPYPSFTLDITFRVNRDKEVRANEILEWSFSSNSTPITMRSPSHKCVWQVNEPVQVKFRWAANSPLQPLVSEGNPNLSVQGEYATFAYNGTWGLLRLLRIHQASSCDFASGSEGGTSTLKFEIPLTNIMSGAGSNGEALTAVVFNQITTAPVPAPPPAKKDQSSSAPEASATEHDMKQVTMGTPVGIPYFPFHAPNLSTARFDDGN